METIKLILRSRGFLIFLIIILISALLNSYYQSNKDIKQITRNNEILKEKVETWKDNSGTWRAKARTASGTIDILRSTHKDRIDSITKYYDIKISDLKASTSLGTDTEIDVSIPFDAVVEKTIMPELPKNQLIGLQDRPFSLSTKWYEIKGVVRELSVDMKINVYDSISFITYWEREKLFKPKELKVEAKSHNPHTKVTFIENISVNEARKPRFAIVAYGGVGIGGSLSISPQIGIGVGYKLWEF